MIYIGRQPAAAPITSADIANDTIVNDDIAANAAIAQSKLNLSLSTSDISGDAAALGSGASADGYVLTSDGAGGAAWEEVSGGGVGSFVATGSISSGDIVGLRSDGTVEVIAEGTQTLTNSFGYAFPFSPSFPTSLDLYMSATFDSNTNRVVIAYTDTSNSKYGTAVVGTVSGDIITFGDPVVFANGESTYISATFDSNTNKIVIAYRRVPNSNYGFVVTGTVVGDTIFFGSTTTFNSSSTQDISATFDSNSNRVVIAYYDSGTNSGRAVVGTVSGIYINIGAAATIASSVYHSATFDSDSNKVVVAYSDFNNSFRGTARVGTVSGTTISFGSPTVFQSSHTIKISTTFDSNTNKVVVAYTNQGSSFRATACVGTVSGTSIYFGTPVELSTSYSGNLPPKVIFDSNTNKVVVFTMQQLYVGTVSGTSISFGSPQSTGLGPYDTTSTFDSASYKIVVAYLNSSDSRGSASVVQAGGTGFDTNADTWIGIAAENIADTASGTVTIIGSVAEGLTGLTPGATYYANYDGTLTATENAGPLAGTYGKIGRALSSTKLLITEGNA